MFDPQNMPSSAGGFPWKADGDYTTLVYIKNETSVARKFVSHLIYESGQYSLGIRDIKPGETIGIDFRELRDNQYPDSEGNLIPLDVDNGQIAWSVLGTENKVLSGRSEQVSLSDGIASTYACANCCPNVIYEVFVNPFSLTTAIGMTNQFTTTQTEQNCYGTLFGPYEGYANQWNSFNSGVATVDPTGNSEAVGVGDTSIQGCVERTIWFHWGGGYCEPFTDLMCDAAPVEVVAPRIDNITPGLGSIDASVGISIVGEGFGNSPTVNVGGGGITANVQSSSDTSISVTLNISADATAGNHSITVTANGQQSNSVSFFVQVPTKLQRNSMSALQNEGGCGAVRNLSYTLLDQNGDPINTNGTISEGISGFSGPPGVQPPSETERTMSQGTFPDVVGYNIPTCPPPFTATFVQSFTVHLNTSGHAWALGSQNSVSMGRTSAGTKFVDITFTQ